MSKFVPSFPDKAEPTLYHAIPGKPRGNEIAASSNYGALILPAEREKLGMPPDEQTPLVFAATRLGKALAFAIPKGEKLFNTSIESAGAEIVIATNRDNFMKQPIDATVYSFPGTGFVQLPNMQHQSVSTQSVPFSRTKEAAKLNSMDDLMRAGLQVFSFREDFKTVHGSAEAAKLNGAKNDTELMATMAGLIKSGKVVWENQARGINPNPKLAKMMEAPAAVPRKAAPKTRRPGV